MKIKGYNMKNPQTVNQTTVKRILESNLHPLKTHKFKQYIYSYYKKQITKKKHNITQYIII